MPRDCHRSLDAALDPRAQEGCAQRVGLALPDIARIGRRTRMTGPFAASLLVHAAVALAVIAQVSGEGARTGSDARLVVQLAPATVATATMPSVSKATQSAPVRVAPVAPRNIVAAAPPAAPAEPAAPAADAVPPEVPQGGSPVEGHVADATQLTPELLLRMRTEFPVEVAFPVRVHDPLVAEYPAAALAAGEEGTVVLWIVFDPNGVIEELETVAGPEALAAAAKEAIRPERFRPAANNGVGIRYPIALAFDFRLPEGAQRPEPPPAVAALHDAADATP